MYRPKSEHAQKKETNGKHIDQPAAEKPARISDVT